MMKAVKQLSCLKDEHLFCRAGVSRARAAENFVGRHDRPQSMASPNCTNGLYGKARAAKLVTFKAVAWRFTPAKTTHIMDVRRFRKSPESM